MAQEPDAPASDGWARLATLRDAPRAFRHHGRAGRAGRAASSQRARQSKALIVDLAQPHLRARSAGLYYQIRSLAITLAAFVGGLLSDVAPTTPFYVAGVIGAVGTLIFALSVEDMHAA